jgi:hypothetical protein
MLLEASNAVNRLSKLPAASLSAVGTVFTSTVFVVSSPNSTETSIECGQIKNSHGGDYAVTDDVGPLTTCVCDQMQTQLLR